MLDRAEARSQHNSAANAQLSEFCLALRPCAVGPISLGLTHDLPKKKKKLATRPAPMHSRLFCLQPGLRVT